MPLSDPIWATADAFADTGPGRSFIRSRINKAVDSDGPPSITADMAEQVLKRDRLRKALLEEATKWIEEPGNRDRLVLRLRALQAKLPVEKQAALQDMTELYQKKVGSNPLLDTAALSAGAGLVSYLAGGPIIKAVSSMAGVGSPQIQAAVQQYFADPENVAKTKRRLALMAAAAGALYGVYKHSDWTGGMEGFKKSMTDPEYWKKNPERQAAYTAAAPLTAQEAVSMGKTASYNDPYYDENIHVPTAISIVGRDPVLFPQNRARVASLVAQSSNNGHTTSGFRITDTALQSGVDFSAAYLFGQGLGRVLALPQPVVNRVSAAGGVAAAVIGSGVLSKLGF